MKKTNKNKIVERLLDQGHIVIKSADMILNRYGNFLTRIEELKRDGQLSTNEVVVLLIKEDE